MNIMRKEGEYSPAALKRAETRRQKILDWLWAHGSGKFAAMFEDINDEQQRAGLAEYPMPAMRGALASMLQRGEIAATGRRKDQTFVPLVKVTEPGESMRQRKLDRNRKFRGSNPRDRTSDATKAKRAAIADEERAPRRFAGQVTGGKTTYKSGDNPDIRKQQRGQGAVREKVHVNCFQLF